MKYWWVNQNGTYKYEVPGGYMWSPQYSKSKKSGKRIFHQPYENMRHVSPGDLVFPYAAQRVFAVGHALGTAWEAPRPDEFADVPQNWTDRGWRVDVDFTTVDEVVREKDFLDEVRSCRAGSPRSTEPARSRAGISSRSQRASRKP